MPADIVIIIQIIKSRKMKIRNKIECHYNEKKFSRITRKITKNQREITRGYIIGFSDSFIAVQLTEDFKFAGFNILPIDQIKKIRFKHISKILFDDRYIDVFSKYVRGL